MSEPREIGSEVGVMLFLYSEWLDCLGLMVDPKKSKDNRTHEELVRDFINRGAKSRLQHHA